MQRAVLSIVAASLVLSGVVSSALAQARGREPISTVVCDRALIGVSATGREPGMRRVLGIVDAPRGFLANVGSDASVSPFRHWAKAGIEIRAGTAVTVSVARRWRHRVHITWGSEEGTTLRFAACSAGTRWNAYAGGFVSRTATVCVPLIFTAGRRQAKLLFGIGQPCQRH